MLPVIGLAIPWVMKDPRRLKAVLAGVVLIAVLWSFKMWLNARDARARAKEQIQQIEKRTSEREKELDAKQKELDIKEAEFVKRESDLAADRLKSAPFRTGINDLKQGLGAIDQKLSMKQSEVAKIPVSELDLWLRRAIAETEVKAEVAK